MNEDYCTLCDLPLPGPPVTDEETDGVFCCTGCLHVYKLLEDIDGERAEELRRQTIARRRREAKEQPLPETCESTFLKIEGMHCATCESFVETLAVRQPGVFKCEASYASEMVKIYFDPARIDGKYLPEKISRMGYTARPMEEDAAGTDLNEVARLLIGGFFSITGLLLYALFFYPGYVGGDGFIPLTKAETLFFGYNILVMTTFVLAYTGYPILRGAWVSLSVGRPNMDLLIAIAACSAWLYSIGALLSGSDEIYFDVTMAIVMVVSLGHYYERQIKTRKNSLLSELTVKQVNQARLRRNGRFQTVAIDRLKSGDRVLVRAGECIPIDGTVVKGEGVVNEALITGESLPVRKRTGDRVVSGTILKEHSLEIETDAEVQSTIDTLIQTMWNIQAGRSGRQRLADRIAAWFVPVVLVLGVVTFGVHLYTGDPATNALLAALAVLIVSCPCALGLATPLAVASGIREALKNNIVYKTGALFEEDADTGIIALDKTGTLTTGRMQLLDPGSSETALTYARALEQHSSHPVAQAIRKGDSGTDVQNFRSYDAGVSGEVGGQTVFVGQPEWLEEQFGISDRQWTKIGEARSRGQVPVGVAWQRNVRSILVVGDHIRPETVEVVTALRKQGKRIAVITGDSEAASQPLRERLNPDFLFTGARPDSKTEIIRNLQKFGPVAMVGDGSNDAPALAEAGLGIAFGDATAIAAESAQIVIPGQTLRQIPLAFEGIRRTRRRIRQNLGWAFLYNITTIPLAVAGLINPLFAALAMAASSLLVVGNSSRSMNF